MSEPLVIDYETHWASDYTLRKLSIAEYIYDPRFEVQGLGILDPADGSKLWLGGHDHTVADMEQVLIDKGANERPVMAFNTAFDAAITEWRMPRVRPPLWLDVMGMSRAVLGNAISRHSLEMVGSRLLGSAKQQSAILNEVKGLMLHQISRRLLDRLGGYCVDDLYETYGSFVRLKPHFPKAEVRVMDWTIRMFVRPTLRMDWVTLNAHHERVQAQEKALEAAMYAKYKLRRIKFTSPKQFAEVLREYGVEPPTKTSPTTGKQAFAMSKMDLEFMQLLHHADEDVRRLVKARLKLASNIERTRAKSYMNVAGCMPEARWPVALHYAGAIQTQRLSGHKGGGGNPQNLGRKSPLRRAVCASPGNQLTAADSANIELRVAITLAGQLNALKIVAEGGDLYAWFASKLYGFAVSKDEYPQERTLGKVAVLSLQYGSGWMKFRAMAAGYGLTLSSDRASEVVYTYRDTFDCICKTWRVLDGILNSMACGIYPDSPWPFLEFGEHPLTNEPAVLTPSGLWLQYPGLHVDENNDLVHRGTNGKWVKIYGARFFENLCQHLAKEIVTEQTMELDRTYPVAMFVHDEAICDTNEPKTCEALAVSIMRRSPDWWPELVLDAEAASGLTYADAK